MTGKRTPVGIAALLIAVMVLSACGPTEVEEVATEAAPTVDPALATATAFVPDLEATATAANVGVPDVEATATAANVQVPDLAATATAMAVPVPTVSVEDLLATATAIMGMVPTPGAASPDAPAPPELGDTPVTPSGWKVITSQDNLCQMAVPPDWTEVEGLGAMSPAMEVNTVFTSQKVTDVSGVQNFEQYKQRIRQFFLPGHEVIEDSEKRLFIRLAPGAIDYILAQNIGGGHVCSINMTINGNHIEQFHPIAAQVLQSLGPASK